MESKLTLETLRAALGLDPETGVLRWLRVQSNRIKVGDRAGVIARNGRRYVNIGGEKHLAHRLVWFHHYGVWPIGDVKQLDGDYDNCAIGNLIEQSRQETASKRRVNAKSKSGHAGVTWDSHRNRWQVHITRDYKQIGVGSYERLEDAVAARQEAVATGVVVSPEEKIKAAHAVARRRRQRMAWQRLERSGLRITWPSLDEFCIDIGDVPETQMAIVPVDHAYPVGPGNWKWSLPIEQRHDFSSPEGRAAYGKAHRQANPDVYRDKELRKKFGITLAQYREKLAEQGGVCAICNSDEVAERNGQKLSLAVDHDHDTKQIRGILCIACNTGIGKLNDSPSRLRKAADYLEAHEKRETEFDISVAAAMKNSPHRDWLSVATLGFGA